MNRISLSHFGLLVMSAVLSIACSASGPLRTVPTHDRLQRGLITLNFDDGYESVYTNAVPVLRRSHIPATFYIITSTYKQSYPDYMRKEEILTLAAQGNEIGVHTRTTVAGLRMTGMTR